MAGILIVDDDEADRVQMGEALGSLGHRLYFAEDGESAMRLYLEHAVRVVVTDIVMARVGGLQLISNLKALKPDVVVIAVSGKGESGLSAARASGAAAILTKPLDAGQLKSAVVAVIGTG